MARLLLKSGIVVTQDAKLGVLPTGDVLVENDRIAAIAPALSAPDAETVDCRSHFVLPGLINAHMHTWQTALRSIAADWTLLEYFRHVHAGLATVFVPDDIHIATLAGALNQLDHGVTTLVDWAHNNPTPEHTDPGIAARPSAASNGCTASYSAFGPEATTSSLPALATLALPETGALR